MMAWAVSTAIAVSALIFAVLLLRKPVGQLFGARAAYALWAAPLLRAVTPPLPEAQLPVPATAAVGHATYQWVTAAPSASHATPAWPQFLIGLWLAGAAVYLGVQLFRHHQFLAQALRGGRPVEVEGIDYDIVASPLVGGPMATGLTHPLILVPIDFTARFSAEQQRLALLHEQSHHRRGDIWASAAALVLTALLWFNPFAHLALGAFRRDMEAACDARVLADSGGSETAPAYAETILRCAATPMPRSLCALTAIDELKGRLTMLKASHGPARRFAGLAVAGAMSATGLVLAMPAAAHEEGTQKEIHEKTIVIRDGHEKHAIEDVDKIEQLDTNCDGEKVEVSAEGGAAPKKQAIKLMVCADKGDGPTALVDALTKASERMEIDNKNLDPKIKAELKSKIEAKIRELRAKG
jgi:beta-lactamase regulating signal transducer with metallopeptidase domain